MIPMNSHNKKHQPWAPVALFENAADCQMAEKFLQDKGFEVRTHNDKLLQCFLFLCPPRLTYRLQVRAGEFKIVNHLFHAEPPPALAKAVHCPSCDSLEVNYPQMTRKFFLPTLALHLGIIFRIIEHECYCEHCHHTWNLPNKDGSIRPIPQPAKVFPFNRGE
jgi:hypothetical protein